MGDTIMNMEDQTSSAVDGASEDRAQAIRDQLRDAIVDRRLAPGTKLSESEVGSLFDVSRTVVRAALQMLTFEGLVRSERNRGAFVANPSPEEARQVFASRRLIEPGIALAACERIAPARHRRLPGAARRGGPLPGRARAERPALRDQGIGRFPSAARHGRRQCHPAALHGGAGGPLLAGHRALRPLRRLELRPCRASGNRRGAARAATASAPRP